MADSFASLAARIEACIPTETDEDVFEWDSDDLDGARAALAEMKERAEKLEGGLLAFSQFWTTPEFIAMQQAAMLALAAVTPSGSAVDHRFPNHVEGCICPRFKDIAPSLIADLTCPIHGINGSDPGDVIVAALSSPETE